MKGPVRIAVDIGGTFTDLQFVEESSGRTASHKTPTTPENPAIGLVTGIQEAMKRLSFEQSQVSCLMHGTTIATNAVLQRRFPKAALLTTVGFEDVLEIGRHVRRDVYSQIAESRAVLIPRRLRFGVHERIDGRGEVLTPLDDSDIRALTARLTASGVEVVAICLLNSFANAEHEQKLARQLQDALPELGFSLSTRVSPEAREYERTSTTVLNALLMPVVGRYLDQLGERLGEVGIKAPVYIVQSNGGVTTPDIASEQPVRLILSGPSGGARAVEVIADRLQSPNLIAIDMGGTSFDVAVIQQGQAHLQNQGEIDAIPVRVPMLEIRTIGAGGGSLASVEDGGRLTVGPQSSGAQPGPAAYGNGGTQPTVTDANVALGRIDPDYFLGGSMSLDQTAARAAIAEHVAGPLALDADLAASGIIDIAVSHMAAAIRLSLYEKGLDPIDFALVSFGGAGGLHAALVARELGTRRIVFPPDAGTQSAWGMLFANVVQDVSQSLLRTMNGDAAPALAATLTKLGEQAEALMDRSGVTASKRRQQLILDMRYPGQGWELGVNSEAAAPADINPTMIDQANGDFHRLHLEQFAHNEPGVTPELVTVRLRAIGMMDSPQSMTLNAQPGERRKPDRSVFLDGRWQSLEIVDRAHLAANATIDGPAVIEEPHSTILLPGGWHARVDSTGMLIADDAEQAA